MRQIKASEIQPGMTIRWDHTDMRVELPVKSVRHVSETVVVKSPRGRTIGPSCDELVTVLAEPQPEGPQPEEPKVPERIEEWPEDDEALRPYPWRDCDGYIWTWLAAVSHWECYDEAGCGMGLGRRPKYGPWTRVTDE